jgi:hypothetical protein
VPFLPVRGESREHVLPHGLHSCVGAIVHAAAVILCGAGHPLFLLCGKIASRRAGKKVLLGSGVTGRKKLLRQLESTEERQANEWCRGYFFLGLFAFFLAPRAILALEMSPSLSTKYRYPGSFFTPTFATF